MVYCTCKLTHSNYSVGYLFVCFFVYLSIYLFIFIYLFIYLFILQNANGCNFMTTQIWDQVSEAYEHFSIVTLVMLSCTC